MSQISNSAAQAPGFRSALTSIGKFHTFVPKILLWRYCESVADNNQQPKLIQVPGAVLFLDVSGFTPLAEALGKRGAEGAEILRNALNQYLSKILEVVDRYGGDVIKFAGDALLVIFYDEVSSWAKGSDEQLSKRALKCAIACGLAATQVQYSFTPHGSAIPIPLRLKGAIGVGRMFALLLGSGERAEFLVAGDPLLQVSAAERHVLIGKVALSPQAYRLASDYCATTTIAKLIEPEGVAILDAESIGKNELELLPASSSLHLQLPSPIPESVQKAIQRYVPESARLSLAEGIDAHLVADIREVSMLFCSFVQIDTTSEKCLEPMQTALLIVQEALSHYRGSLRQFLQEDKGVTAIGCFGLPMLSSNKDALRCVKAAMRMQDGFRKANLSAFVGVTTGKAFCGTVGNAQRNEYAVVGSVVNLSARLMVAATNLLSSDPGYRVLIDQRTYDLTRDAMQYNVLAPVMVKGKSESVPIFQPLLKVNRNVHHQEKLIGRTSELKILTERVEKMRATCEGGAVLLVGPPGGGKSMICAELLRLISSSEKKSTVQVVRTALRDIQRSSAFILIRSLLDQLLHQSTEANGKKKISKEEIISDLLQSNHSDLLSLLPLLNPILALEYPETSDSTSLGGAARREKLLFLLASLLHSFAKSAPLILYVDNFNHVDLSSFEVLQFLLCNLPNGTRNLLLLVNYTQVAEPSQLFNTFVTFKGLVRISVDKMVRSEMVELLRWKLNAKESLPSELETFILEKSLGSPAFAISLLQSLLDTKIVQISSSGSVVEVNNSALRTMPVPDRLEKLITSKIDQLHPVHALILRVCSCIASHITLEILAEVVPLNITSNELAGEMVVLEKADLLVRSSDEAREFEFKQNIVMEVAYSTLAFGTRQTLHNAIAEKLLSTAGAESQIQLGVIASHFERGRNTPRAIQYYRNAADLCLNTYSQTEAIGHFMSAIKLLESEPNAAPTSVYCYLLRCCAEAMWSLQYKEDQVIPLLHRVLELGGEPLPKDFHATIPEMKKEALRFFLEPQKYRGSVKDPERRAILSQMMKVYARDVRRLHFNRQLDPDGSGVFYYSHRCMRCAELIDSFDVWFHHVIFLISPGLLPTTKWSSMWRRRLARIQGKFAIEEAKRISPLAVSFVEGLVNVYKIPADFAAAYRCGRATATGFKNMSPAEFKKDWSHYDSAMQYEECLNMCCALALLNHWPEAALQNVEEMKQTARIRYNRLDQELAQRIGTEALLRLDRVDEASQWLEQSTQLKLPEIGTRCKAAHMNQRCIIALRKGNIAAVEELLPQLSQLMGTLPILWFWFVYLHSHANLLFSYCDLRNEAKTNAPRTSAYHVSSCRPPASAFTIPEEALSEMRWLAAKRLWDYTMSVPELALISWTMQAWWLHLEGQKASALRAWRFALKKHASQTPAFLAWHKVVMARHGEGMSAKERNTLLREAEAVFAPYNCTYDLKLCKDLY